MPQLSITQRAINAQPGMPFDMEVSERDIISRPCSAIIPFGIAAEMDANGLAIPAQDATTGVNFKPNFLGISMLDPLAQEQAYIQPQPNTLLAGTVTVTNNSTAITFSTAQTLGAGTAITFSKQPGTVYFLASAVTAGTAGTLTAAYTGTTATGAGSTTTVLQPGSSVPGYSIGKVAPFMRKGRIWVKGDGGGTQTRYGTINLWHSSTGANPQGVFTFTAVQTTVGAEIDVAPNIVNWNPDLIGGVAGLAATDPFGNVNQVYLVEINA